MRRSLFLPLALLAGALLASPAAFAGRHDGDEQGEEDYDRAQELHNDKHWDEAAAGWVSAFNNGYREETSAYNAACAYARAGKKDAAFQWLEKAYQTGFELEDYLDDDDDLRSLRNDPRFATFQSKVLNGRTSRKTREAQRLLQKYQTVKQQKDSDAEDYDDIGKKLLDADRYEEAAQAFQAAAAREEDPSSSLYNAACARSLGGQKGPALDLLKLAVEQGFADPDHLDDDDDLDNVRNDPRFAQIRGLAVELEVPGYPSEWDGNNSRSRRKWQSALAKIDAAARNHPQLGQAWFNVGLSRLALQQADQAIKPFEKAVELGYHKAASMYNLACAHSMAGHKDEAFAWLDRAVTAGYHSWWSLRQDPDLDDIRYDPRFRKYLDMARAQERAKHHD